MNVKIYSILFACSFLVLGAGIFKVYKDVTHVYDVYKECRGNDRLMGYLDDMREEVSQDQPKKAKRYAKN